MIFHRVISIFRNTKQCGSSRKIHIREPKNKGKGGLYEVVIKGFQDNDDYRVVFDGNPDLSPYHSDGPFKKACDAVVVCTYHGHSHLIFIELKSSSINLGDIEEKFKSSLCFIDYSSSILKVFYNEKMVDEMEKRYIVFREPIPMRKLPTRHVFEDGTNNPSKPMIIPYEDKPVPIRKLINIV